MDKQTVIVIVGPTASGKTSLSVEIAKKIGGEIVSADSMQIYRDMDIATAKPTVKEMQGIPHHLISIIDSDESFSVASYKEFATKAIADIFSRNRIPVVVGGTGLYIDTLINNTTFFDFDKSDEREKLQKRLENEGIEKLFSELKSVDPETAERLHINDTKRILRALEVYYSTGRTISLQAELSHENESEYKWFVIGLTAEDRAVLYDRINSRVDIMISDGLIEEAEEFFASEKSSTAKQAIGYKELKGYFDGSLSFEEAAENLKRETRRYAKRQLTWFRRNKNINWINIDGKASDEILEEALGIICSTVK